MTLIYPEGSPRSFQYEQDISRFVDAWLVEGLNYSALPKSAFFEYLLKNKKTGTGDRIAWNVYRTDTSAGASTAFNIFNPVSDTVVAQEPDAFIRLETEWKNNGRKIKLSKIRLAAAEGKTARMNYLEGELTGVMQQLFTGMGRQVFRGNPSQPNYGELTGLNNIISYNGSYGTKARTLSRALVGNVFDALNTNTSPTVDTGWSVTYDSPTITKTAHGLTVVPGDLVDITDASGEIRTYVITANNVDDLQIAPAYEGPTAAAVNIRVYSPFADTAVYGAAGEVTYDKLDFAATMASDGNDVPNLGVTEKFVFHRIRSLVAATERSITTADLSRFGVEGSYESFLLMGKPIIVDNHANRGDFYWLNTNYLVFKALEGYDRPTLTREGLMPVVTDNNNYQTVVGEVVIVGDICCTAVNRQARLTNLIA